MLAQRLAGLKEWRVFRPDQNSRVLVNATPYLAINAISLENKRFNLFSGEYPICSSFFHITRNVLLGHDNR